MAPVHIVSALSTLTWKYCSGVTLVSLIVSKSLSPSGYAVGKAIGSRSRLSSMEQLFYSVMYVPGVQLVYFLVAIQLPLH